MRLRHAIALALALGTGGALTPAGLASRPATPTEKRVLVPLARRQLPQSWQGRVHFVSVRVSTKRPAFATARALPVAGAEGEVGDTTFIYKRFAKGWRVVNYGTTRVACGQVPAVARRDLLGGRDPC
jgi:hypothetical protein